MYSFIDNLKVVITKYKFLIYIVVILLVFLYIIHLRVINRANPYSFITDVQKTMVECENMFTNSSLDKDIIIFASDNTGDYTFNLEEDKNYYIKMNRNGYFLDLVFYDNYFCYESVIEAVNFDKNDIVIDDVYRRSKKDSYNGCNGEKIK